MWNSAVTLDVSHTFVGIVALEAMGSQSPVSGSSIRAQTINGSHSWFGIGGFYTDLLLSRMYELQHLTLDLADNCYGSSLDLFAMRHICGTQAFSCSLHPQRMCPKIQLMAANPPQAVTVVAGVAAATLS